MKKATIANGELVFAGPEAPDRARCPVCGHVVYLRSRQKMGSKDRTYFWQHERGSSRDCRPQRRVRPPVVVVRS